MPAITEIPFEILDRILSFNYYRETKDLACCSRDLYTLLQPLIWRKISIHYPFCGSLKRTDDYLRNLTNTHEVGFYSNESTGEKLALFSLHLGKLLSSFDRGRLQKLVISRVPAASCVSFIFESLDYVRVLKLSCVKLDDWSSLASFKQVKTVFLDNCDIDDAAFKTLLRSNQLEKVDVIRCKNLSNGCLHSTDHGDTIKEFRFGYNGYAHEPKPTFELNQLTWLKNVTSMTLCGIVLADESLVWICENLTAIRNLNLQKISGISYEGFRSIGCLTGLNTLDIELCDELSEAIFLHIEAVTSLRKLAFDLLIYKIDNEDHDATTSLEGLNRMPNLREITIRLNNRITQSGRRIRICATDEDRKNDGVLAYIFEALCHTRKWGLQVGGFGYREFVLCR